MVTKQDKNLVKLIECWIEYSSQREENTLEGFAAWLYKKESLTNEKISNGKNIGLQILELSELLQRSINTPVKYREYRILEVIDGSPNSNKLSVIQQSGFAQSVGFYVIRVLHEEQYISQTADKQDARSRIINLTSKGKNALQQTRAMFKGGISPAKIFGSAKDEQEFYKVLLRISSFERKSRTPKRV